MRHVIAVGLFLVIMIAAREVAHLGWLAVIAMLSTAFAAGIVIENRMRSVTGQAPYSLAESCELAFPLSCLIIILAAAYCVRWLI